MGVKDQTCPSHTKKRLGPLMETPWPPPEDGVKDYVAEREPQGEWVKLLKLNSLNAAVSEKKSQSSQYHCSLAGKVIGVSTTVFRKVNLIVLVPLFFVRTEMPRLMS